MKKFMTLVLLPAIIAAASFFFLGCDGGGNGGGRGNGQTTIINGRISDVIAMNGARDKSIKFAELIEMPSIVKDAKAQGGITVSAIVDGEVLDTTVTDPGGSFSLSFDLESAQSILLEFDVDGTIVSVSIMVQAGSVLDIVVTIDLDAPPGEEVEIVETEGPIRCQNGTLEIIENPGEDIVIDGGGEDCIRTEGNCNLVIDPGDIILTNCERCVDARGTSQVTLATTDGDIICGASGDGIRARGNASVVLDVVGNVDIAAAENGAKADGSSFIGFTADACIFDAGESTFDVAGNAAIDADGCGEIIEGPAPLRPRSPVPRRARSRTLNPARSLLPSRRRPRDERRVARTYMRRGKRPESEPYPPKAESGRYGSKEFLCLAVLYDKIINSGLGLCIRRIDVDLSKTGISFLYPDFNTRDIHPGFAHHARRPRGDRRVEDDGRQQRPHRKGNQRA